MFYIRQVQAIMFQYLEKAVQVKSNVVGCDELIVDVRLDIVPYFREIEERFLLNQANSMNSNIPMRIIIIGWFQPRMDSLWIMFPFSTLQMPI